MHSAAFTMYELAIRPQGSVGILSPSAHSWMALPILVGLGFLTLLLCLYGVKACCNCCCTSPQIEKPKPTQKGHSSASSRILPMSRYPKEGVDLATFRDPKGSCLESSSTGRPRLLPGTGLTPTQIPVIEIDSKTKEEEPNLANLFGTMAHWDEGMVAFDTLEDHKGAETVNTAKAAPFPPLPPPVMKAEEDKGPWWSQLLSSPVKKLKLKDWSMNFYSKVVPKLELPPVREVHHGEGKDNRSKRDPKRNRRRDLPKRRSANNMPKPTLQWAVKLAKSKSAIRDVVKRVEDDFYANSSRASKNSKRNTVAELLKAGGEGFPLTPYALKLIVGTLREAGYKSTSAYLVEAKLEHVENGHPWSNNLERHFKLCMTAAKRGTGPRKKAVEVPEDTWSSHSLLEDPVQKGMKVCFSALLFACGTHWMVREIELANLVSKDVCFEPKGRLVSITWNESKTDKEGRGIRRTLQCLCEDNCDLKCPYAVLEVLVNRAALKGAPGGHLAIDHKGRPASKADIVKDWKKLYGDDTTGHSTRRSGALQYIRKGWPVAQVGYLGRWKSNIIMEYAQEALEAMAINSSNHFGMEDSQFNLAQKLISSHAAPTDLSKDIEAKADREVVAKLQDDIIKFKAATKDSNKSLESAIADLDERMKSTAPFLPFLVISAKQQVIHQNAKLLAFAPPRSWRTRCGWYYYASNYEFADGDDTMVTCIKCQQSALAQGGWLLGWSFFYVLFAWLVLTLQSVNWPSFSFRGCCARAVASEEHAQKREIGRRTSTASE
eukprot:s3165_g5.t1